MDFDEDRIYYSHQNLHQPTSSSEQQQSNNDTTINNNNQDDTPMADTTALRRHYREFLRNYRQGSNRYIYRDRLLRMHRRHHRSVDSDTTTGANGGEWNPNQSYIHVDLAHVGEYDAALLSQLLSRPGEALPVFEVAAADALRTLSYNQAANDNAEGGEEGEDANNNNNEEKAFTGSSIQILLRGNLTPTPLRSIQSRHMNLLLKCPGIIVSAARSRPRAMCLRVRCGKCMDVRTVFGNSSVSSTGTGGGGAGDKMIQMGSSSPFSGFSLPTRCLGPNPQGECPCLLLLVVMCCAVYDMGFVYYLHPCLISVLKKCLNLPTKRCTQFIFVDAISWHHQKGFGHASCQRVCTQIII
jgi:hypothetical protein